MEKAISGLGGLIFLFFVLSQFVAYFNYSNMGTLMAREDGRRAQGGEYRRRCRC